MSQDLLRSCLKLNKRTLTPQKTPRHNTQPDNVEEDHREAGAEKTGLHLASDLCSPLSEVTADGNKLQRSTRPPTNQRIWSERSSLNPLWAGQGLPNCTGDTTQAPGQHHNGVGIPGRTQLSYQEMYCSLEYASSLWVGLMWGLCLRVEDSQTPRLHIVKTEVSLLFDNLLKPWKKASVITSSSRSCSETPFLKQKSP